MDIKLIAMRNIKLFAFAMLLNTSFLLNSNAQLQIKHGKSKNYSIKQQHELLKQLALCSCIKYAFSNDDSIKRDLSFTVYRQITSYKDKKVYRVIDSAAKKAVEIIEPGEVADYDTGKRAIMLNCINYYYSKRLDSLVRSLDKYIDKEELKVLKNQR